MYRYKKVGCGGTFDLFHAGHRVFLREVFSQSSEVFIGITSDSYVQSVKQNRHIESYENRKAAVLRFLQAEGVGGRAHISPLENVYIPKVWEQESLEALFVTEESKVGAQAINKKREAEGRQRLPIHIVPFVLAEDRKIVSSTRIRKGEIDREGRLYLPDSFLKNTLLLPESVRLELKKPFGEILPGNFSYAKVNEERCLAVGDVTTKLFHDAHITPFIAVVDFLIERKKTYTSAAELGFTTVQEIFRVSNPPGNITHALMETIQGIFAVRGDHKRYGIIVEGEEDLAVLPLLLASPLGFEVYYGQPGVGSVRVIVSEQAKDKAKSLVSRFKVA
ncbi:MAG: pantetheine-phosphate adenylyltransferase [Candidatus Levybacteria bacterium]|nr:pantetheine-phosphate adenylyltransferase [Candidatus Levybacteria bacterium]